MESKWRLLATYGRGWLGVAACAARQPTQPVGRVLAASAVFYPLPPIHPITRQHEVQAFTSLWYGSPHCCFETIIWEHRLILVTRDPACNPLAASALALAVSSTAAAPFINPAALAVGNEGVLVSLPVRSSIHKPCHGAAGGLSEVSGLKAWLASALGRSRVSTKPARQHASSWTIIRLMSDVETQPTALNSVVPHVENVYGRPGYASVEDARRHRDLQLARPHHHRQATALGRFNEALEELSFAEGLFVSFVLGAGLGVRPDRPDQIAVTWSPPTAR